MSYSSFAGLVIAATFATELMMRTHVAANVRHVLDAGRKALRVLASKRLSDAQKQLLLMRYSLHQLLAAGKMMLAALIVLSPFAVIAAFFNEGTRLLLKFPDSVYGNLIIAVSATAYYYLRRSIPSVPHRRRSLFRFGQWS